MPAPSASAGSGDGTCSSTDICVFNDHGRHCFNDGAYIGDSLSGWTAGSGTSRSVFKFFVNVYFKGAGIQIAKGTKG
ncbi:hypothetical protein ABIE67_005591 [Streptomyces sp. V4I8]|uniref:hypothetical protein n=1 Tax=Streptomyces sp. V4I8 TaxID=3156469 RepID=UPI003513B32C